MILRTPLPGYAWNPLRRHRNVPCPCKSGKKAKLCHGRYEAVPEEDARRARAYLRELALHGFIEVRPSEIREEKA